MLLTKKNKNVVNQGYLAAIANRKVHSKPRAWTECHSNWKTNTSSKIENLFGKKYFGALLANTFECLVSGYAKLDWKHSFLDLVSEIKSPWELIHVRIVLSCNTPGPSSCHLVVKGFIWIAETESKMRFKRQRCLRFYGCLNWQINVRSFCFSSLPGYTPFSSKVCFVQY